MTVTRRSRSWTSRLQSRDRQIVAAYASITAVACSSGSRTASARCSAAWNRAVRWWARRPHRSASAVCQPGPLAGKSRSSVLLIGKAPAAIRLSAPVATIRAVSSGPAEASLAESLIEIWVTGASGAR